MSSIIVLDSSDDETGTSGKEASKGKDVNKLNDKTEEEDDFNFIVKVIKRKITSTSIEQDTEKPPVKRIKPTQIATTINKPQNLSSTSKLNCINGNAKAVIAALVIDDSPQKQVLPVTPIKEKHLDRSPSKGEELRKLLTEDVIPEAAKETVSLPEGGTVQETKENGSEKVEEKETSIESSRPADETTVNTVFASLLAACRTADPSQDMDTLIKKKLVKYYHSVHPDFVESKSFSKTVKSVISEIQSQPNLVYYHLKTIVEELKTRKKSKTVVANEEVATTGNKRRDRQIKRLSHGLHKLTKKIAKLEAADVDFDEDINSTYIQVERLKRRACEIYEKICDLTGESKHAHRLVKKPITFKGSPYPEFNRVVQAFVNKNNSFPDFCDVLTCLEHCNKKYNFGLRITQMQSIAQDAFVKIGKAMQSRRKTDLYETVTHFAGSALDPAETDPELSAKLAENQKHYTKIGTLIEKYAIGLDLEKDQSKTEEQAEQTSSKSERLSSSKDNSSSSSSESEKDDKNEAHKSVEKNNNKVKTKTPNENLNGHDSTTASVPSPEPLKGKKPAKTNKTTSGSSHIEEIVISDEDES